MKGRLLLAATGLSLLVTGCASNSYCLGKQPYENAEERPPLQSVGDLKLPDSPTALRVPPKPANPVPFGVANAKGDGVCLDKPPAFTPSSPVVPAAPPKKKK
jgi:hypothetical protein